ncbi:hypothetical protein CC2G_006003 [Coprinopsis cinerea AmutBmut pab1-1]|nr:hypothetical protein CC2G_006003 [Coprinopsis cinerea AmutBmut pab1-1]
MGAYRLSRSMVKASFLSPLPRVLFTASVKFYFWISHAWHQPDGEQRYIHSRLRPSLSIRGASAVEGS